MNFLYNLEALTEDLSNNKTLQILSFLLLVTPMLSGAQVGSRLQVKSFSCKFENLFVWETNVAGESVEVAQSCFGYRARISEGI